MTQKDMQAVMAFTFEWFQRNLGNRLNIDLYESYAGKLQNQLNKIVMKDSMGANDKVMGEKNATAI